MKDNIKIIPLGGVREVGENLYAIDIDGGIYVLNCGLRFPKNEMLGIDLIIPDFSYLEKNRDRIVGVFLTDGSLSSIGALPYFLARFKVPVFGSKLTLSLAKNLVHHYRPTHSFNRFNVVNGDSEIIFNDVTITFFRTTYSIPDSMGIVLNTKSGEIVYTGNFNFDQTVPSTYRTDLVTLSRISQKPVLALLSNSNDAEDPHQHTSEYQIQKLITNVFSYRHNRIVVGCMSSKVIRLQEIFNAAATAHRRIYLPHPDAILKIVLNLHLLRLPTKDLLIDRRTAHHLSSDRIIILQTGRMGEPIRAIQDMTNQWLNGLKIQRDDLVLVATTPGHALETKVAQTKDMVCRACGKILMISDRLNSTDNANWNDLQLMLNLIRPQYLIPVQGEFRMLKTYAKLAQAAGMAAQNIIIPAKGDVIAYQRHHFVHLNSVNAGNMIVDGSGVGDVGNIVLRDRKVLSTNGILIAVVTISHRTRRIVSTPEIVAKGFVYEQANRSLLDGSALTVRKTVQTDLNAGRFDWSRLKQDIRNALNSYLFKKTSHHPVIMPVIMEIH